MDIADCFTRYEWAAVELEPGIWRASFAIEQEVDFDLYVMVGDEWIHFAVSPFLHIGSLPMDTQLDTPPGFDRLYASLLQFNQRMRIVRFGLDDDGDINLLADLPRAAFDYAQFAHIVDALHRYTDTLAFEVRRIVAERDYHSPLL